MISNDKIRTILEFCSFVAADTNVSELLREIEPLLRSLTASSPIEHKVLNTLSHIRMILLGCGEDELNRRKRIVLHTLITEISSQLEDLYDPGDVEGIYGMYSPPSENTEEED